MAGLRMRFIEIVIGMEFIFSQLADQKPASLVQVNATANVLNLTKVCTLSAPSINVEQEMIAFVLEVKYSFITRVFSEILRRRSLSAPRVGL